METSIGPSRTPEEPWLSIADASRVLGVTTRTVRRRIADGRYQARWRDGQREVSIPSAPDTTSGPATDTGATPTGHAEPTVTSAPDVAMHAITEMGRLLDAERQRASAAEQAAAMLGERVRNLEAEAIRLREQLALPAPRASRPWWAFWRRGS